MDSTEYYVVKQRALPEVLLKVVEAKRLVESKKSMSVQEAVDKVGISRSSFYKYKDDIFKFRDNARTKTPNAKRIYNRFNVYRDYFENDDFNSLRIINSGLAHQFREIKRKYNTNDHVAVYHVPEMKALMQKYGFAEDYARFAYRKLTKAGYNLDIDI